MRFDLVISFDAQDRRSAFREAVADVEAAYPGHEIQPVMATDFAEESYPRRTQPGLSGELDRRGGASMARFVVFDVETPNRMNNRISAIGITVIENGGITQELHSLVNPETYFDDFNIRLTGIDERSVWNAPTFPELWAEIEPVMSSGLLAAHNAVFDLGVLKKSLRDYGIGWKPYVRYLCTVQMGRRLLPGMSHSLNILCDYYGICLNHHQAGSDSHACAEILLRYMENGADIRQFIRTCSLTDIQRK